MGDKQGWILLHRQIIDMPEWFAEPFTRGQAWVDLLLLANYRIGYIRRRGILVAVDRGCVGYSERELASRWKWSRDKVRRFLVELVRLSRISHKICEKTIPKNSSVSSVICIENYDQYQGNDTESDTEDDTENDTRTKKNKEVKETPCDFSSEISVLEERYPDQELIKQAFKAISSTRKTKQIADSVKLKILQSWNKYPIESVTTGIKTYLEKGYADQGKDEKYLLGIIRNAKQEERTAGPTMKSTGSRLLDNAYRSEGYTVV